MATQIVWLPLMSVAATLLMLCKASSPASQQVLEPPAQDASSCATHDAAYLQPDHCLAHLVLQGADLRWWKQRSTEATKPAG